MKKALLFLSFGVLLAACSKKDDNPTPNPNPGTGTGTGTTTNPYYFKFKHNGKSYNLAASQAQYMSSDANFAGGYMEISNFTYPSMMLQFGYDKPVTDSMMKALSGKTFYYDNKTPEISLGFDSSFTSDTRYSVDTNNKSFFLKVNSITYLKKDTTIFNPVAVYVINGTCNAILKNYNTDKFEAVTEGEFNFLISRVDKK